LKGISRVILANITKKCPSKSDKKAQKAGCLVLQFPPWIEDFWEKHPALLLGIAAAVGCSPPLAWLASMAIFLPLFFGSGRMRLQCGAAIAIATLFAYSCHSLYTFPEAPGDGISGSGEFTIHSVSVTETFGKKFRLRGVLSHFTDDSGQVIGKRIPCTVLVPYRPNRPPANTIYMINGTLRSSPGGYYRFIPKKMLSGNPSPKLLILPIGGTKQKKK